MNKSDIRHLIVKKRLALSEDEVSEKGLAIQQRFLDTSLYQDASIIALYSSFRGEVVTDLILGTAFGDGKGVVMPRINPRDFSMIFFSISGKDALVEVEYGFKEPLNGEVCETPDIDLFIVPGVAYDTEGNRLGLGKGYYDRVLADVETRRIVALAYEFQLTDSVPAFSHDMAVGYVVTEERLIETENNKH